MLIIVTFAIIVVFGMYIYGNYLKEYIEVTKVYKVLRKVLESRDLLVLKLLPDIKKKKISEKILNLITDRNEKSKISYDDAIIADIALHNELRILYEIIDKQDKNELQEEIFKKIIAMEKKVKLLRKEYSKAVEKYNMSLTVHPKVCIKMLHMKPLEMYAAKE